MSEDEYDHNSGCLSIEQSLLMISLNKNVRVQLIGHVLNPAREFVSYRAGKRAFNE